MKRLIYLLMLAFFTLPAFINAQDCYEVIESNTGIPSIHTEELDQIACELLNTVNGFSGNTSQRSVNFNFEVVGCDFYPILAYASQTDVFSTLFNNATTELDNTKESYGMVTKEHAVDGTVNFRTHIKFPTTGAFVDLTPFERLAINSLFLSAIENYAEEHDNSTAESGAAETAGWAKLNELFQQVLDSTLDIEADMMKLADFESAPVDAGESFSRDEDEGDGIPHIPSANNSNQNVVFDFTGLEVSGELLKDQLSVDLIPQTGDSEGFRPFTKMVDLKQAYIITDDDNTRGELTTAEQTFNILDNDNDNTKPDIIIWLHFELNDLGTHEAADSVYVKYGDNLTDAETEAIVNEMFNYYMSHWMPDLVDPVIGYRENGEAVVRNSTDLDCDGNASTCNPNWRWGATCILPAIGVDAEWDLGLEFQLGLAVGLFDGLLGTVQVIYETGKGLVDIQAGFWKSVLNYTKELVQTAIAKRSMQAVFAKVLDDSIQSIKKAWNEVVNIYKTLKGLIVNLTWDDIQAVVINIWAGIVDWMGNLLEGDKCPAYDIGVLLFDVLLTVFSGGAAAGATFLPRMLNWLKKIKLTPRTTVGNLFAKVESQVDNVVGAAKKVFRCKILGKGCFVAGTPVLLAGMVATPIEEVELFDWAIAHETVNMTNQLTASIEDPYLRNFENTPYTSDQQRRRDQYELNDSDWYEVIFEELKGSSYCKLALHKDWMQAKGIEKVGSIHHLNMPEQGIRGNSVVTSIKHILPQKRPVDDEDDSYTYKPVTGVFVHQSDHVWNLKFDNDETLGVTYNHPIYSTTKGNWKLAGELEIGETVRTKSGETTLIARSLEKGVHTVYNLEIKDYHNFLVENEGILVHNTCFLDTDKMMRKLTGRSYQKNPGSTKKINRNKAHDHDKIKDKYPDAKKDDDGNLLVCFDDYGFPDFGPFAEIIVEIDMNGNSNDFTQAVNGAIDQIPGVKRSGTVIDEITYTWHHHQDGKSMMLIPSDINNVGRGGVAHTGGNSLVNKGLKGKDNPFAPASNPKNSKCN